MITKIDFQKKHVILITKKDLLNVFRIIEY